ncbi:hypothetical protein DPSP01_004960 [Paraphaeosphaeria sporulosa]
MWKSQLLPILPRAAISLPLLLGLCSIMGVHLPPTIARAGRHARTLAGAVIWLCVLYIAITNIFASWFGAVFWTPYLVLLVWLCRRECKEIRRKRAFDAHLSVEQLAVVLDLRQIVEDVDAHTACKRSWTVYFTWQYWRPRELPPKPSLEEVESALQESEEAVGPYDINIGAALRKLLLASRVQQDMDLERKILERFVQFLEHTKGRDQQVLIQVLARAGQLHFAGEEYTRAAQELSRALDLHRQLELKDAKCRGLMTPYMFMFCKKMLAMAHTMAKDSEAAEALCAELLAELEQKEGMLNTEPLGTQMVRGMLISVYIRRGWKALNSTEGGNPTGTVSRYLRDALSLVAVHPAFYAHNLKQVGRLFIWAGRAGDGDTAFRLSNAIFESGIRSGTPQRNCLCSSTSEVEEHGLRICNACSRQIALGDRWFFCRICVDTDLCAECYAGFGRRQDSEWEDVDKFPRECLAHEFYEVREDEREEEVSVQMWIAETVRRLDAEMSNGDRGSEVSG